MARKDAAPAPAPHPTGAKHPRRVLLLGWLAISILLIAAYWPALNGPFVLDDGDSILHNRTIRRLETALFPPGGSGITVSGRPLLNLSLAINYALSGRDPRAFRLTNIGIHLLTGLAIFGTIRRTLGKSSEPAWRQKADWIGLATSALWLLHPLQTESVSYVVQRAESLVALFYVLTLYSFARATERGERWWYFASWAACIAGMATKEVMVSAPLIVLLYDRTYVARSFSDAWKSRWSFYAALAGTWILLGGLVAGTLGRGGSVGATTTVTPFAYLLTQAKAISLYLRLSLWPSGQIFDYGANLETDPVAIGVGVLVVGTAAVVTLAAVRSWPPLGFLGALFFAVLAPSSSIVPVVTQTIAEHRMYLPLLSVVTLATLGAWRFCGRAAAPLIIALCLALALATWNRNHVYSDALTLWQDTTAKRPLNARAHNNLGVALMELNRTEQAIEAFQTSISLDENFAEPRGNLGKALLNTGKVEDAQRCFDIGLKIKPQSAGLHMGMGNTLLALGRPNQAIEELQRAVALDPELPSAHFNLANALAAAGQTEEALSAYAQALATDPKDAEAYSNLAMVLRDVGRIRDAVTQATKAVELRPESAQAHNNLALILVADQQLAAALPHLREAVRLSPTLAEARLNLGMALAQSGQYDAARTEFRQVLEQYPGHPGALQGLRTLGEIEP